MKETTNNIFAAGFWEPIKNVPKETRVLIADNSNPESPSYCVGIYTGGCLRVAADFRQIEHATHFAIIKSLVDQEINEELEDFLFKIAVMRDMLVNVRDLCQCQTGREQKDHLLHILRSVEKRAQEAIDISFSQNKKD